MHLSDSAPLRGITGPTVDWWRGLFDSAEKAMLICDAEGAVLKINAQAGALLRLPRVDPADLNLSQILTPQLFQKVAAFLKIPGQRQITFSGISLMSEGHLRLIADIQIAQLSEGHFLVELKDASRRWRVESHAQRLATAIEATSDIFFFTDTEFRLGFVNSSFQTVTGYTIEEVLGHTADFLRSSSQAGKVAAYLECVRQGRSWSGELLNLRRDGTEYPVESTISPFFDKNGELLGYVACERDVTAKKKLQEELLLERNFTLSILDSIESAIYAVDGDFLLTHMNDGWKKMPASHGFLTLRDPPALKTNFFEYVDPAKAAELRAFFQVVMATRQAQVLPASSPNGHWVVKISPWFHEKDVRGIIYAVSDDGKLHELQKMLYQAQKMETIGTLAAGVAHDFNNLLQVIRGNVELALMEGASPSDIQWNLQQISEVTERAAGITHQMLSFSRDSDEQVTVFDFNGVLCEVSSLLKHSLPANIVFELKPHPGMLNVQMDLTRANQLVLNLCVNARDAMPGGGKVTVSSTPISLSAEQAACHKLLAGGRYVRCTVTDTGVGIAPDVLPRIFDPFFTTKENGKGTGLGLSIAHDAICRTGGFIEVESKLGSGTTFHVYLPAVDSAANVPAEGAPPAATSCVGSILVVDDLELIRDFTQTFLQLAGYTVRLARDGAEALKVLEAAPVDLLFTDNKMPGISGVELIDRVAARWPEIKCVLASGYLEDTVLQQMVYRCRARILKKPYHVAEALQMISEMLAGPAK